MVTKKEMKQRIPTEILQQYFPEIVECSGKKVNIISHNKSSPEEIRKYYREYYHKKRKISHRWECLSR